MRRRMQSSDRHTTFFGLITDRLNHQLLEFVLNSATPTIASCTEHLKSNPAQHTNTYWYGMLPKRARYPDTSSQTMSMVYLCFPQYRSKISNGPILPSA
jgi:hypothetical protein